MQTSSGQVCWNDPLAAENAEPDNWDWNDRSRFQSKWYGSMSSPLDNPGSPSLSLEPLPPYSLPSILLRKSYTGTIITGQPGTGKTLLLYYLLVRLLHLKQVVLFSLDGVRLHLFYHDKVHTVSTMALLAVQQEQQLPKPKSSRKVFIWSLFDIREQNEPERFLVHRPCLPVQAALLDPIRYETWYEEESPLLTGLPLWTRDELARGLPYQQQYQSLWDALCKVYSDSSANQSYPLCLFPDVHALLKEREEEGRLPSAKDALDYLLEAAIDRFGYSARDVFGQSSSPGRPPLTTRPFDTVSWNVNFKSDWVARSVIRNLAVAEDNTTLRHQIRKLRHIPHAQSLVGQFLEPLAHRSIAKTCTGSFWPLINMASNNADPPQFVVARGASSRVPDVVQFAKVKREIVKFQSIADLSKENTYYMPADSNFPLFDAFTVDLDYSRKSAVLWVLQMTMSRLHEGSAMGYLKIRKIITSLKNHLGGAAAKKTTKWAAGQTSSEPHVEGDSRNQWHFPKGWNENCSKIDHRGRVYCLEVPIAVCSTIIKNIMSFECIASRYPTHTWP
ncbi:hypothetical protein BDZ97DRAFT_1799501 [Flammula alnicola]|nr:hypothetical protein BDZ97DRAFT_1799501 [Flammula alnicola]